MKCLNVCRGSSWKDQDLFTGQLACSLAHRATAYVLGKIADLVHLAGATEILLKRCFLAHPSLARCRGTVAAI